MGSVIDGIDGDLAGWLLAQHVFFVATAPSGDAGHVNCSPKGLAGTFRVLDPHRVAYLDLTGSGVETIAHLRQNGRIVLMWCAFEGRPRIIRMHGTGVAYEPGSRRYAELIGGFHGYVGARSIICVDVERISDSCGYGVPTMGFAEDRRALTASHDKRGAEGLREYRERMNARSIDDLPGIAGGSPH